MPVVKAENVLIHAIHVLHQNEDELLSYDTIYPECIYWYGHCYLFCYTHYLLCLQLLIFFRMNVKSIFHFIGLFKISSALLRCSCPLIHSLKSP